MATFTQKTFVGTKAINQTTDNAMAKRKRAIISEISSSKHLHLKQQVTALVSPGVPILSTNKTYQRDITEVLLYVALNNIAIYLIHLI
jgi:hypothetical protein